MSGLLRWPINNDAQDIAMLDILMLALAAGLFAAGVGYAYVCERL